MRQRLAINTTALAALFASFNFLQLPCAAQGGNPTYPAYPATSAVYPATYTGNAGAGTTAPVPAATPNGAPYSAIPAVPLRPPISTPSYYTSNKGTANTNAPVPIGALPPGSNYSTNAAWPPSSPPPVAPAASAPTASTPATTSPANSNKHHKGLAEDTVDVGAYVVKAYVYTYIVLPSKLVKGTINALF